MSLLGNLLWIIFGGFIIFLQYLLGSLVLIITIIGIPFGIQTLKLATLALFPFGKKVVATERAGGCLEIVLNVIWVLVCGISIALTHLLFAALMAITIIGIPFAIQHVKLAGLGLAPFGREVVDN